MYVCGGGGGEFPSELANDCVRLHRRALTDCEPRGGGEGRGQELGASNKGVWCVCVGGGRVCVYVCVRVCVCVLERGERG